MYETRLFLTQTAFNSLRLKTLLRRESPAHRTLFRSYIGRNANFSGPVEIHSQKNATLMPGKFLNSRRFYCFNRTLFNVITGEISKSLSLTRYAATQMRHSE